MNETYSIPKMKIELFKKHINKMSRKAEKLGLEKFSIEHVREYVVEQKSSTIKDLVHHIPYVDVAVSGEAPQIEGFNLVAMLERFNDENIVKRFNVGSEKESVIDFEELAYRNTECDHCNSNRARKYIMVLQDDTNGELIQVGKACLKDYTNSNYSAEQIASYFEGFDMIHELEHVTDEEISCGGGYQTMFRLDDVLAIAIELTDKEGYKPSSFEVTTKQEVCDFLLKKKEVKKFREMLSVREYLEYHASKIEAVKEFFVSNNTRNEYAHNLKVILKSELIEYGQLGYAVSAYSSYLKTMDKLNTDWESIKSEREANKQAEMKSEYVGEIGERSTFELVFDRMVSYEGRFGVSYMYFFKDNESNVFLWGTNKFLDFEKGDEMELVGTIKEHKDFRDVKQTVITRCKIN